MSCCREYEELIWAAAERDSVPAELREHLVVCEGCRASLEAMSSAASGFTALRTVDAPDPRQAVCGRLSRSHRRPALLLAFMGVAAACSIVVLLLALARPNTPMPPDPRRSVRGTAPLLAGDTVVEEPTIAPPPEDPPQRTPPVRRRRHTSPTVRPRPLPAPAKLPVETVADSGSDSGTPGSETRPEEIRDVTVYRSVVTGAEPPVEDFEGARLLAKGESRIEAFSWNESLGVGQDMVACYEPPDAEEWP